MEWLKAEKGKYQSNNGRFCATREKTQFNNLVWTLTDFIMDNTYSCNSLGECKQRANKILNGLLKHGDYYKDMPQEFKYAVEVLKKYCQNETCTYDCAECPFSVRTIRCGDIEEERPKNINHEMFVCSICDASLKRYYSYCPECGQKLKWD